MTDQPDRIKQMAQEAEAYANTRELYRLEFITRFAQLVAEDCANACDERYAECFEPEAKEMAQAIRARYSLKGE